MKMRGSTERNTRSGKVAWLRGIPRGVARTKKNKEHFLRVPSAAEWAHQWALDHGRPPTTEQIDRHFVNGPDE